MTKLLNAQFHELFKSKYFYLTSIICVIFGAGLTTGMYLFPQYNQPENSRLILTKENILGVVPSFATLLLPFAAAATVAVLLDSQYNHGTIRNMICCGHTRTAIFFSNLITMSAAAAIYFVLYQVAAIFMAVCVFDFEGYDLKATVISLSAMLLMLIFESTVISLLLGNLMRGGKLTIVILVVQYILNISVVFGMYKYDSIIADIAAKIFPQSCVFYFSCFAVPEGIWKNFAVSAGLIAVMSLIGLHQFKKCDIK
ncbi:MAG: ABC transporter permease [Ruminococcus sp.]|uniref:ABC transporter permease subunit n=1 Tax=Ruminococcus sp. TaxID=41978 RepID=UPI0025FB916C|nr:ABC transporter permease subunit [Ruminococcus sp.]MBO4865792.1 ABC transporter permease [Ruminococcus sp.]